MSALLHAPAERREALWRDWLVFAVTVLGLSPAEFWGLALRDWLWLLGACQPAALDRAELQALRQLYPDGEK